MAGVEPRNVGEEFLRRAQPVGEHDETAQEMKKVGPIRQALAPVREGRLEPEAHGAAQFSRGRERVVAYGLDLAPVALGQIVKCKWPAMMRQHGVEQVAIDTPSDQRVY